MINSLDNFIDTVNFLCGVKCVTISTNYLDTYHIKTTLKSLKDAEEYKTLIEIYKAERMLLEYNPKITFIFSVEFI